MDLNKEPLKAMELMRRQSHEISVLRNALLKIGKVDSDEGLVKIKQIIRVALEESKNVI